MKIAGIEEEGRWPRGMKRTRSVMEWAGEQIERPPQLIQTTNREITTFIPGVNGSFLLQTFFEFRRGVCLFICATERGESGG